MLRGINWFAVLAAVVLIEVLGYVWYAYLFADMWREALGYTPDPGRAGVSMGLGVITTVISVVGLAWLIGRLGAVRLLQAVGLALAVWFFFNFTTMAIEYLYLGHKAELVLINIGFQIVSYVAAAIVLALLKPKPAVP